MQQRNGRGLRLMLTEWDLIAIIIALAGSITVMFLFWKQNILLQKEIRRLQVALRSERLKK
jgi:hypothetical protein